jgi:uncharacterized membrane protein YkvA (DUF1232 family)
VIEDVTYRDCTLVNKDTEYGDTKWFRGDASCDGCGYLCRRMNLDRWKAWARSLKREVQAMALACKDARTPWYAKAIGLCVVAYACSPIDLIPDPIPVLGYLDDLLIVPAGLMLVRWLIPAEVLADARAKIMSRPGSARPVNWIAGGAILLLWACAFGLTICLAWHLSHR